MEDKQDKNRIKEIRKARNMTQVELAQKLGVAQGTVQKLETDQVALDTKWLRRIAGILEVEPYELLPLDMQPQTISPEEMEILRVIRKSFNGGHGDDNQDISQPAENKSDIPQPSQPPHKSNER